MKPSFLTSQVANGRDPFQVLEMPMRHDRHASWYYEPDTPPKGTRALGRKEYPQLHQANKDWVNKYNSEHTDTRIEPNAFFHESGGPFETENHHVVVADVSNAHTGEKIGFFNFAIGRWPHPSTPHVTGYINNVESHHSDVHDTENKYPGVMSGVLDHWANYLKSRGVKHFYANDDISAGLNPRKGSYWVGRMAPKHRDVVWGGLAKSFDRETPHYSDLDHVTQASVMKHKDMYKGWPGMRESSLKFFTRKNPHDGWEEGYGKTFPARDQHSGFVLPDKTVHWAATPKGVSPGAHDHIALFHDYDDEDHAVSSGLVRYVKGKDKVLYLTLNGLNDNAVKNAVHTAEKLHEPSDRRTYDSMGRPTSNAIFFDVKQGTKSGLDKHTTGHAIDPFELKDKLQKASRIVKWRQQNEPEDPWADHPAEPTWEGVYFAGGHATRWGWVTRNDDGKLNVHRGDTHPTATHHDEIAHEILGKKGPYKAPKSWDESSSKVLMNTPGVARYVFRASGDLHIESGDFKDSYDTAKKFMRSPYHTHPTLGAFGRQVKTVTFDSPGLARSFSDQEPKNAEIKLNAFHQMAEDLYHGTPAEYVPSILAVGLQPCSGDNKAASGDSTPPSVSLTTSKKVARKYAGYDGVILKVDVPGHIVQHSDEFEKNSVKTHQSINPEHLDVIESLREEFSEMFDADELERLFGDTKELDKPSGSTVGIHRVLTQHGWNNVPASDPNHAVYQHPKHGEIRVTDWEGKVVHADDAKDTDVDISKELKPHGISTSGPLHVRMQSYTRGHWLHMYQGGGQGHEDLDTYLTHLDEPRKDPVKYMSSILRNHGWEPKPKEPEILKSGYPAKEYALGPNAPHYQWVHKDHPGNEIHLSRGSGFMPSGFEHRRADLKDHAINGQNTYVSISSYLHNNARHGGFKLRYGV